jgi:hypothetical protein
MTQNIPDGWEVLSRHGNYPHWWVVLFASYGAEIYPDSITWTIREKATGTVRKITAQNEAEATARIEKLQFDPVS